MNEFTIEIIQTAVSFLPFLIAFTLIFSRKLGKYWLLPTAAFALNSAYRIFALYEAAHSETVTAQPLELLVAFAPSIINFVMFLGMLSIQISLLRDRETRESAPVKLLSPPPDSMDSANDQAGIVEESKKKIPVPEKPEQQPIITHAPVETEPAAPVKNTTDQRAREEFLKQASGLRQELNELLELARFNGALKKPRKKRKVPKRRKLKKT